MLRKVIRKLGDALILGVLVIVVLVATACGGLAATASPEPATMPTEETASDGVSSEGSQADVALRLRRARDNDIRFERISLEQGLSQSVVLCILQDSKGFMWFGTQDGLNRYDGYEFTVYKHDPENPNSLSDNFIRSIYEDQSGMLWIGTQAGGLDRFDGETEQFTHYRNDPNDPHSLSNNQVWSIYQDQMGVLWIGTDAGLDRLVLSDAEGFDRETEQFIHYQNDPKDPHSLSNNQVWSIYQDQAGVLWIGTFGGGLDRFDRETEQFIHYKNDPKDPHSLSDNSVQSVYEDQSGVLWIGTDSGGLNRFDRETEQFIHYQNDLTDSYSLSNNDVQSIYQDREGVLWVGTDAGLDRLVLSDAEGFDRETGQFIHYQNDPKDPHSLSSDVVWSVYQDREGVLWVGTFGGGLNRFDRDTEQFVHYQNDPSDPHSLSNNVVWSTYQDREGVLWIGTNGGGLDRFDRETGQSIHYRNDPKDPHSLSSNVVWSVNQDREGVLWVGTDAGLDRLALSDAEGFDRETEQFIHYSNDPVMSIYEDREGVLWIGTYGGGLDRLDRNTEQFVHYHNDPSDPHSLGDTTVVSVYQDREGVLWIGTFDGGLDRFDRDTEQFVHYPNDPNDPHSLSHNLVLSIHQDREGVLWIGTANGLSKFDRAKETFTHYREKDGLPNDVIYGILEDDHGNLWLSTNGGLSKFDPQAETFKNYDAKDGLQSNEFNQGAYYKSSSGEMFFGGINGFNAFHPDRIKENSYIPPVVLTSLTQGGEEIDLGKAVEDVIEVTFSWPNNFFGFEFAALSYNQPEDNQYAYMLEGFEERWNYVGTRRFGRYTNLPGGTYILRLKGSNNDGIWNEEGVSVAITIVPPFWETWWFRGIIALLLVGSVIGGYRLRVRSIEARSREFENQVANQTKELAALNAIAATVSQSLDLDQVLNDALDKTLEVMEIEAGGIYLVDEEAKVLTVAAQRGFSPQFVAEIDRLKVGEGFSGRVAQSGQPLVVRNASTDPRLTRMVVREEGLRSLAIVPLSSKGKGLGTLFAVTHGYREFTDRDVQLLTSIGHQIGVAVENAQLFETEQRRAEQFRLISKVSRHIISILDVDQLLCEIVRRVSETLGYYMVGIGLIEEDEVVVRTGVGPYWETDKPEPVRLKVGQEGIVGWVAGTGKPLVAPDVTQEPHYYQVLQITETRSELAVPLRTKDKVIGVLDIQSRHLDAFDESDVVVLQSLANQAAMAIENARLFETEQRRAEQFRVISEVGRRIASILDIDEILVQVARLIHQTFDYYHVGIALIEGDEAVYKAGAGALWDDPQFQFRPARLKVGQEGITGWVAAMGKPLLVPDVSQEPRYVWMRDSKTRSELAVPIVLKGEVLGVLDVQSTHLNAFDEGDLMMLQSLANQAAVAIENARFFEAEQRRAEQFRVISEVGHHITSILDVNDLLDEIVGLVKETFGYYLVDILLIEGNDLVIRAVAGPPFDDPPFQASRIKVGEEGITGWVAGTGKPFLTSDVSQEPRYLSLSDAIETRSELCVPLKTKDAVIGVLNIESDQLNAFDESDVMVLQSLANQAAVAIENAQLLAAERQRADELEALRTTLTDITAELELSALLQVIVERAAGLLDATGGELGLYDEASQEIRIVVSHNLGEDYVGTRHGLGEGAMGRVAETGEPLIIKDYHTWEGGLPQYPHIRATLAAPLEVGGRLVGVFTTVTIDPDRQFGPADLHLLNLFAQQAAIAIENARLYEQARQLAVVEERQRLARELHDSVTQALYGVRLYSEAAAGQLSLGHANRAAEHLRELQDTAQEALAEMRLLIYELRPSVLEEEGLVAALQARLLAVEGRAGLKTEFKVEGDGRLPPQIEEGLYRIGQEALNNALKHAHARNITVCLRQDERAITLEIADDGIGFDPTTARKRGGLGLSAMEERAAGLGGRLIVQSGPREGTRVLVEVFA